MGKTIDKTTKEQILNAVKHDGMSVMDAQAQYGVSSKSIYRWLREGTDGEHTSALEMGRLKRENQQLKEIIGMLTLAQERTKKNR